MKIRLTALALPFTIVVSTSQAEENIKGDNIYKFEYDSSSYVIMADPQAWRMGQGEGMPNPNAPSTATVWESFNRQVVSGINGINNPFKRKVEFGIINGDITEFGRIAQRDSFNKIYNEINFPFYIGLGNHDYERNINDCTTPEHLDFNKNSCAYITLLDLDKRLNSYSKKLINFSVDRVAHDNYTTRGSMSYSWDSISQPDNISHFVQLHLAPTYRVNVNSFADMYDYDITDSLSWLRHDLNMARKRGVKNIFINFHALVWIDKATDYERKILKAIFDEYKVSAVFVGHTHIPAISKYNVFGDVPVYTSGALYAGYFDLLTVSKNNFHVTSYQVKDGETKEVATRRPVPTPEPPPICHNQGSQVTAGDFVRTDFLPLNTSTILRQTSTSNALYASSKGEVFTFKIDTLNPDMRWKFQYMWSDDKGDKYYKVTHINTGEVLDGDSNGNIYTKKWNQGKYQYWKVLKYSLGGIVQLQSLGTNRILDGNSFGLVHGRKDPLNFTNNYQNWELTDQNGKPISAERYFKATSNYSWKSELPEGKASNKNWIYSGERGLALAAPCI